MEAVVEFKHPLFQLERNTKHNGRIFSGRKSFLANTMLKILTTATEKTKRSWTYMRENGVDSPYVSSLRLQMVASPEHPKKCGTKKKCLKRCGLIL